MGLETKNDCVGEGQQEFTELDWTAQSFLGPETWMIVLAKASSNLPETWDPKLVGDSRFIQSQETEKICSWVRFSRD
jgi:hypothetical protein